ncbi:MAG: HlyC/CorC family transporter [Nitriliruptoraceae bacterium]|nr:HlyC/CorC family transporter [Nitriliruptoraceae bacterium]
MGTLTVAILVVLVGSALCSGSEAALLTVSSVRVRQLAESGGRRARALRHIKEHIARPISAIVVLNNIFNIVGSIWVGTIATREFGEAWVGAVSGVLTFLVILFSEILPKTVAERHAQTVALWIALPVRWLTTLLTPVVWLFDTLLRPLTRGDREPSTNEAEIRLLARIGRSEGVIEDDELLMLQRVFQLNDRTARDLMTPRTAVTWLDAARALGEVRAEVLDSEHSRILVADGDLDRVVGVAFRTDLLRALLEDEDGTLVGDHVHELDAVPWLARADVLLERFRRQRAHIALVVDEYGGTLGVVSLEDVIEVLTGPIVDETDRRPDLRRYARARARRARVR